MKTQSYSARFIVLCHGRTGSTLFGSLLASHPAIAWGEEEFNQYAYPQSSGRVVRFLARRWPILRINWLASRHPGLVYGCKLAPKYVRHLNRTMIQAHRRGWLLIHLRRRNTFHEAISGLVAKATGRYQHFADRSPHFTGSPPVAIDPSRLLKRMKFCHSLATRETQALAGLPYVQVWYEDDLADAVRWGPAAKRVFDALGLPDAPLQTNVRRTWDRTYADIVTDYAELVEAVRAAGYGYFLR